MIIFPSEYLALLDSPYPICQGPVERKICHNRPERQFLSLVPTELVIKAKSNGSYDDCGVAEAQPYICEEMRLIEFQRREVIW